ncbi:hypothetical protein D918_01679 [Trichuris suis]|nr:hypothetical protein D918_01679 [Trichuris suis]
MRSSSGTTVNCPEKNCGMLITDAMSISASNVTFAWNEHFHEKEFSVGHAEALAELCLSHILQRGIDVVVTYDSEGVSGSFLQPLLHASFILLQKENQLSRNVALYALGSVCALRSIIGLYDIPFAYIFGFNVISVPADLLKLHKLFYLSTDLSQIMAYFILLFNSYFLCNSLSRIDSLSYFEDLNI